MILLVLFIINGLGKDPCVNPRFYWLNNNAFKNNNNWPLIDKNQFVLTENFTQCGVSWIDLYNIDITLIKEDKILWLLLFQEYCGSSLNIAKLQYFLNNLTPEQELLNENMIKILNNQISGIQEYIIKAYNILDSYCDKMADLNFLDSKIYTINILTNLSVVNNGVLIGYCDNIYYPDNLLLDIYTLFYNTTYHDNSKYNESEFLSYKPQYYNTSELKDQFINGNWVIGFLVNKQSNLFLFLIVLLCVFVIVSQTCWYHGNCIICRSKSQNNGEVQTIHRCIKPDHWYWVIKGCLRQIFCCLCDYTIKRRKREEDDDDDDYKGNIDDTSIILDDFTDPPTIFRIEKDNKEKTG
jgi:hypothetical protein